MNHLRLSVLFGLAFFLMACNGAPLANLSPTATPLPPIKIGYWSTNADPTAVWVAYEVGIFQKNGLQVTVQSFAGGAEGIAALSQGQIQFATNAAARVVATVADGNKLSMVVGLNQRLDRVLIVQPNIAQGQDLRGKKLGATNATGEATLLLRHILRHNFSLDPDKDVTILAFNTENERLAALENKQIDGTIVSPGGAAKAAKSGMVVLVDLANENIPYQGEGIVLTPTFASQNPATVRALVKSIVESIAFIKNAKNRDQVKQIIGKYLKVDDPQYLDNAYNDLADRIYKNAPYVSEEGIKTIIAEIPNAKGLAATDIANNAFVKELDESGFIKDLYK